jgi:NADH-quinone oxidoreductase subunit N
VLAYFEKQGRSVETYDDLAGLGWQFPTIGLLMGTFMFSSAGIPPTAGFVGKLYVFKSAVDVGQATGDLTFIWLAVLAVLTSVAGVYYYLRVLVSMYMYEREEQLEGVGHPAAKFALVVCGFFSLYLGILPGGAMDMSRQAVVDMAGAPESIQQVQEEGREALQERLGQSATDSE